MCKLFLFPLNQDEKKKEKLMFLFYRQFSAGSVAPLQDLCCLFPFYWSALRLHIQRFLENLWRTSAMEILSHNFVLVFFFPLNQPNS